MVRYATKIIILLLMISVSGQSIVALVTCCTGTDIESKIEDSHYNHNHHDVLSSASEHSSSSADTMMPHHGVIDHTDHTTTHSNMNHTNSEASGCCVATCTCVASTCQSGTLFVTDLSTSLHQHTTTTAIAPDNSKPNNIISFLYRPPILI